MKFQIIHGDSVEILRGMPSSSLDAMVTDPPAGISFMGKTWDKPGVLGVSGGVAMPSTTATRNPSCRKCGGRKRAGAATKGCKCEAPDWNDIEYRLRDRAMFIEFLRSTFIEARRVLRPGAHAIVWALPRTAHWTATALEDAGFEIRDVIVHLFGTGFPKSLDVSKSIDRAAGVERMDLGPGQWAHRKPGGTWEGEVYGEEPRDGRGPRSTAPATDLARRWTGWGTALKPAAEHWILCRVPIGGTVAANVIEHGTGALNVDACRIDAGGDSLDGGRVSTKTEGWDRPWKHDSAAVEQCRRRGVEAVKKAETLGRWPSNIVLSHVEGCELVGEKRVLSNSAAVPQPQFDSDEPGNAYDFKTGVGRSGEHFKGYADSDGLETVQDWRCVDGCPVRELDLQAGHLSSGGTPPSRPRDKTRYAYSSFAGQENPNGIGGSSGAASRFFYCAKPAPAERDIGGVENTHPTVKAAELMSYLCRLVTPPGGTVIDPFCGSGSTGIGALREGFRFIGIDRERKYVELARERILGDAPLFNRQEELTQELPAAESAENVESGGNSEKPSP